MFYAQYVRFALIKQAYILILHCFKNRILF